MYSQSSFSPVFSPTSGSRRAAARASAKRGMNDSHISELDSRVSPYIHALGVTCGMA